MLKIALTNKLVNAIVKKLVGSYLSRKFGIDGKVTINELYAVEADGRVKLKLNAELDVSIEEAENLIGRL